MTLLERLTHNLDKRKRERKARKLKRKQCLSCRESFRPKTRQQMNNPFCSAKCCQNYQ